MRDRKAPGSLGYLECVLSVGKPVQTNEAHCQLTLLVRWKSSESRKGYLFLAIHRTFSIPSTILSVTETSTGFGDLCSEMPRRALLKAPVASWRNLCSGVTAEDHAIFSLLSCRPQSRMLYLLKLAPLTLFLKTKQKNKNKTSQGLKPKLP